MTATFAQLFGGPGGGNVATYWKALVPLSKTFPAFSKNGRVRLTLVEAGGGGAFGSSTAFATGGAGGAWGRRSLRVNAGQILAANIGAGGLGRTTSVGDGLSGSPTFITLDGVDVMRAPGAPGGKYAATSPATAPAATTSIVGADFTVPGIRAAHSNTASGVGRCTAGGGVDLLQVSNIPADGEVVSRGLGATTASINPIFQFMALEEFGFAMIAMSANPQSPGYGTTAGSGITGGAFCGGAGVSSGTTFGARGGIGGGGGAGQGSDGGNGGPGWVIVEYIADED